MLDLILIATIFLAFHLIDLSNEHYAKQAKIRHDEEFSLYRKTTLVKYCLNWISA